MHTLFKEYNHNLLSLSLTYYVILLIIMYTWYFKSKLKAEKEQIHKILIMCHVKMYWVCMFIMHNVRFVML